MDLNPLLVWLIALSSGLGLVVTWRRHRRRYPGWLAVHLGVVSVALVGYFAWPDVAGWAALATWAPLVLLPSLANRSVSRALAKGQIARARRLAPVVAWSHPFDGWRDTPRVVEAHAALQTGDREAARREFAVLAAGRGPGARDARLQLMRLEQRWAELAAWIEGQADPKDLMRDPSVVYSLLRAHGELGDTAALLRVWRQYAEPVGALVGPAWLAVCRLVVAAFLGRVATVRELLASPVVKLPPMIEAFWVATALQASGDRAAAEDLLSRLVQHGDAMVREPSLRRLAEPVAVVPADALPPDVLDALAVIDVDTADVARHGTLSSPPPGPPPWAMRIYIALNLAMFAAEVPGGTTDFGNLLALGALRSPLYHLDGEWWRVVTSAFLHYGVAHLALNMVALWFFGRYLERVLGTARFGVLYGLAAPGSMLLIVLVGTAFDGPPQLVVGASGGVMGLVGAVLAYFLLRWRASGTAPARRDALMLVMLLAFEAVFDLTSPEVSFLGHASGAVLGFVLGLVLTPRDAFTSSGPPARPSSASSGSSGPGPSPPASAPR